MAKWIRGKKHYTNADMILNNDYRRVLNKKDETTGFLGRGGYVFTPETLRIKQERNKHKTLDHYQ